MRSYSKALGLANVQTFVDGRTLGLGRETKKSPINALAMELLAPVRAETERDLAKWEGSFFEWIRKVPNQSRGIKIGEPLMAAIFAHSGHEVSEPIEVEGNQVVRVTSRDLDLDGHRHQGEIKFSSEGMTGRFVWGNMRTTDASLFGLVGMRPNSVNAWVIPGWKLNELLRAKRSGVKVQGLSYSKTTGAISLSVAADNPPAWMDPFGGAEDRLLARIQTETSRRGQR